MALLIGAGSALLILSGAWGLLEGDSIAASLELAQAEQHPEFGFESVDAWRLGMAFTSAYFLGSGLFLLAGAVGVGLLRSWGRRVSVLGLLFLTAGSIYEAVVAPERGFIDLTINIAITALCGWTLYWSKLAQHFQQDAQQGVPADRPRPAGEAGG